MQLLQAFDATTISPEQGAAQLPLGKHPVIISGSEVKATKANNGGLLELDLQIIDGLNKGQSGAYRLNLYNTNPQAAEIAQKQLSAVCHVTGVFKVTDSSQLHNIPFLIEVGYQKGENPAAGGKGYTEVKRVFDINGNEPGKKAENPAPWQQAPSAPAAAPGWAPPAQAASPAASFPPPSAPASAPWQQSPAAPAGNKPPWG